LFFAPNPNNYSTKIVSLAHLAREVDVKPSHPGSSPHRDEFGFLFSKNKIAVGASPTAFPFKKILYKNPNDYS
jgi:hypothetical protein